MIPIRYQIGDTELFCIQTDRFKSELFSFRYFLPITAETVQMTSLLPTVLERGTRRYPSKLLFNRHLDELYATSVSTHSRHVGDMHRYGFTANFLGAQYVGGRYGILPDVLDAMSELWRAPLLENGLLRRDAIEREKDALRDAIRATINSPRGYALKKCKKLMCKDEAWALPLIGEEDTVDGITPETLTACYENILQGAVPTFWYVGALEPDAVAELVAKHLPLLRGQRAPYQTIVQKGAGAPITEEEEMPVCQGKLYLGFRSDVSVGHELAPAMTVLNEIYGGSPASKLFLNVREKRSLCYHCSSSLDAYKGALLAGAGMTPENRRITEEAMLAELADVAAGRISEGELFAAKRSLDYNCRQILDLPGTLIDFYDRRTLIGVEQTLEEHRQLLNGVTREQVVEAAGRLRHSATFFLKGTLEGEEDEE